MVLVKNQFLYYDLLIMTHRGQRKALPPKKSNVDREDDAILGEVVNPQLVNSRTIEKFADKDREHEDLERFLKTINNFTREQAEIVREHAKQHPDAIENRNGQKFRRLQYGILIGFLAVMLLTLPFTPLSAAAVFGIIAILIVSGVLVNARDRDMDLPGFIKMINAIIGRKEK